MFELAVNSAVGIEEKDLDSNNLSGGGANGGTGAGKKIKKRSAGCYERAYHDGWRKLREDLERFDGNEQRFNVVSFATILGRSPWASPLGSAHMSIGGVRACDSDWQAYP